MGTPFHRHRLYPRVVRHPRCRPPPSRRTGLPLLRLCPTRLFGVISGILDRLVTPGAGGSFGTMYLGPNSLVMTGTSDQTTFSIDPDSGLTISTGTVVDTGTMITAVTSISPSGILNTSGVIADTVTASNGITAAGGNSLRLLSESSSLGRPSVSMVEAHRASSPVTTH